jgi:hypothetical protein
MIDADRLIIDFVCVASLAGVGIGQEDIKIENLSAPHIPPKSLPAEKMAVYVFYWGNQCLKVGKAGPKSEARYTSQHYGLNAPSTLAKSLLKHKADMRISEKITKDTVGDWIKKNTGRINFLMPVRVGIHSLSLLEIFLQCRLQPRFEGFDTQK